MVSTRKTPKATPQGVYQKANTSKKQLYSTTQSIKNYSTMDNLDPRKIVLGKDFDVNNYKFTKCIKLQNGSSSINSIYNYVQKDRVSGALAGAPLAGSLVVQTPMMLAPFGLSQWKPAGDTGGEGAVEKYSLDLSFKCDPAETRYASVQGFAKAIQSLDDCNIDQMYTNCLTWMKTKHSHRDVVKALYTPLFRQPKDKETGMVTDLYPPTFRCNIQKGKTRVFAGPTLPNGAPTTSVTGEIKELDINEVDFKGAYVAALVRCSGLWVAAGKFGCSFKTVQLMVWQPNNIRIPIGMPAFIADGSEDEVAKNAITVPPSEVAAAVAAMPAPAPTPTVAAPAVTEAPPAPAPVADESDDDDDDDEESDDEDIDAAPVATKRVIRKPVAAKK